MIQAYNKNLSNIFSHNILYSSNFFTLGVGPKQKEDITYLGSELNNKEHGNIVDFADWVVKQTLKFTPIKFIRASRWWLKIFLIRAINLSSTKTRCHKLILA